MLYSVQTVRLKIGQVGEVDEEKKKQMYLLLYFIQNYNITKMKFYVYSLILGIQLLQNVK